MTFNGLLDITVININTHNYAMYVFMVSGWTDLNGFFMWRYLLKLITEQIKMDDGSNEAANTKFMNFIFVVVTAKHIAIIINGWLINIIESLPQNVNSVKR